ncbi:amidase [Bordetella pertussis]|nr:amidase [Bordetella pertussis]
MSELAFSSLAELARGLEAGRYSAVELARHYLARIARANEALHAYVSVDEAGALRLAQAADARRAAGYALGPLDGLPIRRWARTPAGRCGSRPRSTASPA